MTQPAALKTQAALNAEGVKVALADIAVKVAEGGIVGIAAVLVRADGSAWLRIGRGHGERLRLLGAIADLQAALVAAGDPDD